MEFMLNKNETKQGKKKRERQYGQPHLRYSNYENHVPRENPLPS